MGLEAARLRAMIVLGAARIVAAEDELCALDVAIGDGDHGANMRRGFEALRERADDIAALPTAAALAEIGRTLVMTVGGASGPLYGSFFLAAGAALRDGASLPENAPEVFAAGVAAVGARGRSTAGEKTMLDVLVPVAKLLRAQAGRPGLAQKVRALARHSLALTAPMVATQGRASYLGRRSVGHLDPGAKSSCLILEALCDGWEAGL